MEEARFQAGAVFMNRSEKQSKDGVDGQMLKAWQGLCWWTEVRSKAGCVDGQR